MTDTSDCLALSRRLQELEQDLREQKRRHTALKKENVRLNTIIQSAPLGIIHFDLQGVITDCNERFVRIIGSSRQALIGLNMLGLVDNRIVQVVKKTLQGENAHFEGDYRSVTAEKLTPVRLLFSPVFSDSGRVDGGIGIIEDISERKEAREALEEIEQRFRDMMDMLPQTIYEVDLQGRLLVVNQNAFEMFGYTKEAFEAGLNVFSLISDKDRDLCMANAGKILRGEKQGLSEYELVRKDGTLFPGLLHSTVIIRQGRPVGFRGFLVDITERKRTHEILVQTEKMMSLGGLAAGMAHEINNPLAGMMQNAQVIQQRLTKKIPANVAAAEASGTTLEAILAYAEARGILRQLDNINSAGHKASGIVRNMLGFSRKPDLEKFPEDLPRLIDQTISLVENDYHLTRRLDFKNIQIIREFDPDVPEVPCKGNKIQQVIFNIMKNSTDAMGAWKEMTEKPLMRLRLAVDSGRVRLDIEDNGPGMDEATSKRIFEPFFTTKGVGDGTGLGLSVSYFIIVEDHDGELSVRSAPGKGTRFSIWLPLN